MRTYLMAFMLLSAVSTYAQFKTSLKGQDVKQICEIPNYDDVLTAARSNQNSQAVLFLDLTNIDKENKGAKAYFSAYIEPDALQQIATSTKEACAFAVANRNFAPVVGFLANAKEGGGRWIATSGDTVWIVSFLIPNQDVAVAITETKRKTRVGEDLAKLRDLFKKAKFAGPTIQMVAFAYTLKETRADLKIQIMSGDGKNPQTVLSTKSGPEEHFSISANLPVNSVKQLKLADNNQVEAKDAPKEFLVGLNYTLGDVYEDYERWNTNRLFATGMIRFSKQPLDTAGVGIGYNLGFVSIFGGPIWIRQPKKVSTSGTSALAPAEPVMRYKMNWRLGVTFDLSTAAGWLKK